MCTLMPAWLCLLLGLLPLEIQSLQSLSSPRASKYQKSSFTTVMPPAPKLPAAMRHHITQGDRHVIWRARLHKEPPSLDQGMLQEQPAAWRRGSRGRRHANGGGGGRGHGHLMRVGCVLGTCQVQNLSHRLYQLIGQSGREDSSPINPRSPHSYG